MYTYRASVLRVVDGDTVDFNVDLGFDVHTNMRMRIAGIDAPELNSSDPAVREKAKLAKERVATLLPAGTFALIVTEKDRREKYGRYLANVLMADGRSLASVLIEEGLAVPYDGGARAAA